MRKPKRWATALYNSSPHHNRSVWPHAARCYERPKEIIEARFRARHRAVWPGHNQSSKPRLPAKDDCLPAANSDGDNAAVQEAWRAKQGGNGQVRISTASRLPVPNTSSSSVWHRAREPLAARLLACRPRNTAALRNKPQPLPTACITSKSSAPRKAQPESAA